MHFGTEQNVGPKPPTVRFEMEAVLAGARSTLPFVPRIGFRRTRTQRSGTQ
jgi:hypothetical protein